MATFLLCNLRVITVGLVGALVKLGVADTVRLHLSDLVLACVLGGA